MFKKLICSVKTILIRFLVIVEFVLELPFYYLEGYFVRFILNPVLYDLNDIVSDIKFIRDNYLIVLNDFVIDYKKDVVIFITRLGEDLKCASYNDIKNIKNIKIYLILLIAVILVSTVDISFFVLKLNLIVLVSAVISLYVIVQSILLFLFNTNVNLLFKKYTKPFINLYL